MSPVFGHGRLRLYLLKLLEESPRHGYEVIRLLQDRFLGVYSPSPGTIYPRLARLESEGLVTHEVIKGKKVYQLTGKGRAELERRMDELAELEEEISASAQEFARGVQQDVRKTVRSLREELTQAAREVRDQGRTTAWTSWKDSTERQKEEWRRQKGQWREQGQALKDELRQNWENAWRSVWGADAVTGGGDPRLEFEQTLRRFVEDARTEAWGAHADDEALAAARALLDETSERLRTEIFRNPPALD
ncbi:PadR family transcriptional regulator [Actinomadura alba]|uniref:Helix-turn-helix transcriptional regulator n=1 Tax=Actinomadura alba TaxID=406431 RepID=A0ABR7LZ40_9ACTN|nr:PadR family transcriptional regulator [Actinomadura alba]MBC6469814.1 helix-turn-helix transcriptional regulator [Actinomadura alba]